MRAAIPLLAALLSNVFAFAEAPAPTQTPLPMKLLHTQRFSVGVVGGEGRLRLTASAPGCSWAERGRESAVITVMVDNRSSQEIVLYGGQQPHVYDVFLGPLTPGAHRLTITFRPDLSPNGARGGAQVHGAAVTVIDPAQEAYPVWKHAPLLFGRDDNAVSDVPLVLFYEIAKSGADTRIIYSLIWSNEDGGTGLNLGALVARWGRATDIEWVYDVTLGPDGAVKKAVIQAAGHRTKPFGGKYVGAHPILRTSTGNNMVSDTGESPLRFALSPVRAHDTARETRERVMDAFPWTHWIAGQEMAREGKWETPADPATPAASDSRNYLSVDFRAAVPEGAALAVQVRLKDGQRFVSDHEQSGWAIARSGWARTTVELPPGTKNTDITQIALLARGKPAAQQQQQPIRVTRLRAFLLDADYRPLPPVRDWSGDLSVKGDAPSPISSPGG